MLSLISAFATRLRRFSVEWRAAAGCVAAALLTACPSEEPTVSRQPVDGAAVEAALEGSVPRVRATFDVYLGDDATLIYVKESCTGSDWGHKFYLHVYSDAFRNLEHGRRVIEFKFWTLTMLAYWTTGGASRRSASPISTGMSSRQGRSAPET